MGIAAAGESLCRRPIFRIDSAEFVVGENSLPADQRE
jgi:hypothetical protein